MNKFTYYFRTIHNISHLLKPLNDRIHHKLLPEIFGCEILRDLQGTLSLPTQLGWLGFENMQGEAQEEYIASKSISAPLPVLVIQQKIDEIPKEEEVKEIARNLKNQRLTQLKDKASELEDKLPNSMKRAVTLAKDKGASNWLNVLPLEEEGYVLNKEDFRDAVYLRYNYQVGVLANNHLTLSMP